MCVPLREPGLCSDRSNPSVVPTGPTVRSRRLQAPNGEKRARQLARSGCVAALAHCPGKRLRCREVVHPRTATEQNCWRTIGAGLDLARNRTLQNQAGWSIQSFMRRRTNVEGGRNGRLRHHAGTWAAIVSAIGTLAVAVALFYGYAAARDYQVHSTAGHRQLEALLQVQASSEIYVRRVRDRADSPEVDDRDEFERARETFLDAQRNLGALLVADNDHEKDHDPALAALGEIHAAYDMLGREADDVLRLVRQGRVSDARERAKTLSHRRLEGAQAMVENQHHTLFAAHQGTDHMIGDLAWLVLGIAVGSMLLSVGGALALRGVRARRREAEALRRSEARFRGLIERAPGAIAVHRDGRVLYVNPPLATILGCDAEGLVGAELAHVAGGALEIDRMSANGGVLRSREAQRISRPDGSVAIVEIEEVDLEYDGQSASCILARDVTERNQLRAQLAIAERMVALGTLAAGIGHEINNPLSYIMGNLAFVSDGLRATPVDAAPELRTALDEAREGATRIRDIVRDFKRFSSREDDRRELVDVRHPLEFAIKVAHNEIRHRARLVRIFDGDLPRVLANDSRLGQVFLNLLLNAAGAIRAGAAESNEIRVTVAARGDGVVIEVQDSGEGIEEHVLGRIFEPFFTTRRLGEGTGLGLAISHRIVAELGGTIAVQSVRGRGTTFQVSLPAGESRPMTTPDTSRTSPTVRQRILLVDDDAMVRNSIRRLLARHHDIVSVESGREALERISTGEPFDIVLCDLMMPEMSGVELFARLSVEHPELPPRVIFMSGGAFTPEATSFLASVPNPQLDKPFDKVAFESTLARITRSDSTVALAAQLG